MDELGPHPRPATRRERPSTGAGERRSIAALLTGYWAFGQFWGVWVILVFEFQRAHEVSDARLGILYTVLSVVAVGGMLVGAPRLQPLPLSASVPIALLSMATATFAIGFLPTPWIVVGFILLGVGNALVDVYLNVAAQRAEAATRRPVLQWLHACYALGGVTGAAAAGLLRLMHLDFRLGFAYASVTLVAAAVWNGRTASREPGAAGEETTFSVTALWRSPRLWVPALVVLAAFLVEGSMDVWSGLYLRDQLGASAAVAATAFIAFAGAVVIGRLFAGRVLFGLGARTTILVAGVGSAAAGVLMVTASSLWVVGFAYMLLGFFISSASPAGFGLVEGVDEDPTNAIAAVTTVGYTGFLWSPALLGYIAQTLDLRAAMCVIVVATLGLVGAGFAAPRRGREASQPS